MAATEVPDREELDALRRRAYGAEAAPLTAAETQRLAELERAARPSLARTQPSSPRDPMRSNVTARVPRPDPLQAAEGSIVPPRPPLPGVVPSTGTHTGALSATAGDRVPRALRVVVDALDRIGGFGVTAWRDHRRAVVTVAAVVLAAVLTCVVVSVVRASAEPSPDVVLTGSVVPAGEQPAVLRQADLPIYLGFDVVEWVDFGEHEGREVWVARSADRGLVCILTVEAWESGGSSDRYIGAIACGDERLPASVSLPRSSDQTQMTSAVYFDRFQVHGDAIEVFHFDRRAAAPGG